MYYETVFIVNPDISQENTETMTNELVDKIEKAGARIVKREYWGSRPLAYSIQKRNRGHYSLLVTDGAADVSKMIDETLRLDERVLRFLTTSITELSDEPSPLLRRRVAAEEKAEEAKSDEKTETKEEVKTESKVEEKTEEATEAKAEEKVEAEEKPEKAPVKKAAAKKDADVEEKTEEKAEG
ncbi:MAG TPA: 30S ribosomal protein S6 [Mariprofundaceae bacterium]|nr:30S ribosomal protein S6 [Mariprofundaceae bacterium]